MINIYSDSSQTALQVLWQNIANIDITIILQVHSISVIPIKAELIVIYTSLIPTMEIDNIYDITVITDSIAVARKILESKVKPLQNMFILLASAVKTFLSKDSRNKIHFWYYPSKAKWPRHKHVDDQVKASICILTFPSKKSYLFSKKKECDNILCKWQMSIASSLKKGHYFEDKKERVIKLTYAKESL